VISTQDDGGIRRNSAVNQLNALAADFTFIRGYSPDDPEIDRGYSSALNCTAMKRPLSRGEIAAYLSHRRALTAFLATDAKAAIVLEDDFKAINHTRFAEQISRLLHAPAKWDLIKLFDYKRRKTPRARLDLGTIQLIEYTSPTVGMVAYLVRRSGAQKLLERQYVFRPIDEDIKFYWELDLWVFSVSPNLVSEISDKLGGSQIEPERFRLRSNRSLRRSVRGIWIEFKRAWKHFRNRRKYGLEAAMRGYTADLMQR